MSLLLLDVLVLTGTALLVIGGYYLARCCMKRRDPLRETIPIINSCPGDTDTDM